MRTKISTVIGGLRIALQSLADKLGVTLVIGGSDARTNGNIIILPDLPGDDEEAALLARGYIDHETAHIRFTDFGIPIRTWLNLIEDVRIEREQGREFPGCAVNMRRLAAHLKGKGHFRGHLKNPLSLLMSWACCRGRSVVLGQPLGEIAEQMEKTSRTLFGDLFCDAFASLVHEIGACRSTADCDDLARRIEALIQNPPEPPPPQAGSEGNQGKPSDRNDRAEGSPGSQSQSGSNSGGVDGQEENSNSDPCREQNQSRGSLGDGDGDEEKDQDEAGQSPSESRSDSDSTGSRPGTDPQGEGREPGKGAGLDGGQPPTLQQLQALKRAASADVEQASREVNVGELLKEALGIEHLQAARAGTLEVIPDTHHHVGGSKAAGDQRRVEQVLGLDQARRLTAQMRASLAGLFQAVRLQRSHPKQVGHRIDREAVHRIACSTPDLRYFSSRRPRPKENTAVVILGDRSGSMNGEQIKVAIRSAFVTAESLELLPGVACAVGFFPWGSTQVAQLKGFGEKPKASRFALTANGGTPMAEALLWAGMKLSHRKEPRKIIVVMTDGHPDDEPAVHKAMERLSGCGIETYGIGIHDRNILHWLKEGARTIDRIEELPTALVDVLKEALVERRQAI
jgi:hypothetical protein